MQDSSSPSAERVGLVIIGCSRGFGREIARVFIEQWQSIRHVWLWSRDKEGLTSLKRQLHDEGLTGGRCSVSTAVVDLRNVDQAVDHADYVCADIEKYRLDRLVIIHNAGTVGPLGTIESLDNIRLLSDSLNVNVLAMIVTTQRFLARTNGLLKITMVNISSLLALQPMPSMGLYCVVKAARDMLLRCVASESHGDRIKTLNYAPGPLQTNMMDEILGSSTLTAETAASFHQMNQTGAILRPEQSARVLCRLLQRDAFESGSHVDYYDVPQQE